MNKYEHYLPLVNTIDNKKNFHSIQIPNEYDR